MKVRWSEVRWYKRVGIQFLHQVFCYFGNKRLNLNKAPIVTISHKITNC